MTDECSRQRGPLLWEPKVVTSVQPVSESKQAGLGA